MRKINTNELTRPPGSQLPSRWDALVFGTKVTLLGWHRRLSEWRSRPLQFARVSVASDWPIVAELSTPLWEDGRSDEFLLLAGKVHNLRLVANALQGVKVPAGEVFSFWRQVGPARASRGYVMGREVREGCVVPAVGGGICQVSNALATAAVQAGFSLVERHAHTAAIQRAAPRAPQAVDATLFYPHIDLRLKADQPWQLEVWLDAQNLHLRLRGIGSAPQPTISPRATVIPPVVTTRQVPGSKVARGCLTCQETHCFRHQPMSAGAQARTAALVHLPSPEWAMHMATMDVDVIAPDRSAWRQQKGLNVLAPTWRVRFARAWNALRMRLYGRHPGQRQAEVLAAQDRMAAALAASLSPLHTRLMIDQALLPQLWRMGVLGGRHVEVWAHSLPMSDLQQRLDAATQRWPHLASLHDYRIQPQCLNDEWAALRAAQQIWTSHSMVAQTLRANGLPHVRTVPWQLTPVENFKPRCDTTWWVIFPASALARKGAHWLAQALAGTNAQIGVLGTPASDSTLWQGLPVHHLGWNSDWLHRASVVALPAVVEHAPRAVLQAVAAGIPVLASEACGLAEVPGVITLPLDDPAHWRSALLRTSR
jgi:hypothetical protein